jgi:hypothetical protein
VLKEYEYELDVLETLLSQDLWITGRRGGWHNRRALILMTHMSKDREAFQAAKAAVEAGLDDPYTHSSQLYTVQVLVLCSPSSSMATETTESVSDPRETLEYTVGRSARSSERACKSEQDYNRRNAHPVSNRCFHPG